MRKIVFVNRMFIMDLPTNEAIFNSIRIDLHMFLFEFFVDDIQNFFSRSGSSILNTHVNDRIQTRF